MQNYKDWPSNLNFICRGLFICGSKQDKYNIFFTFTLTLWFMVTHVVFALPVTNKFGLLYVGIFLAFAFILVLHQLFRTICRDPGVIQRGNLEDPKKKIDGESDESDKAVHIHTFQPGDTELQIVDDTGDNQEVNQPIQSRFLQPRYCRTCKIMRPPRASHCKHCDHCVTGFDHHCFWMGNCIGVRNWRNFIYFLTWCSFWLLGAAILDGYLAFKQYDEIKAILMHIREPETITYIYVVFGIFFFTGCLKLHWTFSIFFLFCAVGLIAYHIQKTMYLVTDYNLLDHYYDNPVWTIVLFIQSLLTFFVLMPVTIQNWINVTQFKTTKEIDAEYRLDYKFKYYTNLAFAIGNIKRFVTYKNPESILGKRY